MWEEGGEVEAGAKGESIHVLKTAWISNTEVQTCPVRKEKLGPLTLVLTAPR